MFSIYLVYIEVDMEAGVVLPLELLGTDPVRRNSRTPDAAVSGSYHSDGDPTPDIPAFPVVGFLTLDGEAAGQVIHRGLFICAYQSVD